MSNIRSAADSPYDTGESPALSANMNVDIGEQGRAPHINTVADSTYEDSNSGQALPTVKSFNLPDDGGSLRSAADGGMQANHRE